MLSGGYGGVRISAQVAANAVRVLPGAALAAFPATL